MPVQTDFYVWMVIHHTMHTQTHTHIIMFLKNNAVMQLNESNCRGSFTASCL